MDFVWTLTIISVVFYVAVNIAIKIATKRKEKKIKEYEQHSNTDGINDTTGNI